MAGVGEKTCQLANVVTRKNCVHINAGVQCQSTRSKCSTLGLYDEGSAVVEAVSFDYK